MADKNAESRIEMLLENLLGADYELGEAQSRNEKILMNMLGANYALDPPESRIEALLIELLKNGGGGSKPTGTIEITENGTFDVAQYAEASVNVSGGDTSIMTQGNPYFGETTDYGITFTAVNIYAIPKDVKILEITTVGSVSINYTSINVNTIALITALNTIIQELDAIIFDKFGDSFAGVAFGFKWECRDSGYPLYLPDIVFKDTSKIIPCGILSTYAGNTQFKKIYVPENLLSEYKTAEGWSIWASNFDTLENCPYI